MEKKNFTLFDKLFDQPLGFLAPGYFIVLLSVTGLGLFFIANDNVLVQNKIPPRLNDSLAVAAELTVQDPRVASAIDIKTLTVPTQAMLDKGKQTFTTICSSCHGPEGNGDGAAGIALNPRPRNFHAVDGWKNGRKVSEMYKTLQFGIQGSGMPPYDYLSPEERVSVISYVRATFMSAPPLDTPADITLLDNTYKLSQGVALPGQIPVSGAAAMISKRNSANANKIAGILKAFDSRKGSDPAVRLFFRVTYSPEGALSAVIGNPSFLTQPEYFKAGLANGLNRNGFSARFSLLSDDEMNILYKLIKESLI